MALCVLAIDFMLVVMLSMYGLSLWIFRLNFFDLICAARRFHKQLVQSKDTQCSIALPVGMSGDGFVAQDLSTL